MDADLPDLVTDNKEATMYVEFPVKTYDVTLTNSKLPYAWIMLFDADGKWRARLNFSPQPVQSDYTDVVISDGFIEVAMNIKVLDDAIDLLRNEKPVTAYANSDYDIFMLSTGEEPVGEGEIRHLHIPWVVYPPQSP